MDSVAVAILLFWEGLSWILGFTYVVAWSLSFYPQPLANWRRRSTAGTTIDYPIANLAGFTAYTVYTGSFLLFPTIKDEYAARHPHGKIPTVRSWDFAFALHGWIVIAVLLSQYWLYRDADDVEQRSKTPSRWMLWLCGACLLLILVAIVFAVDDDGLRQAPGLLQWIDVVYALSAVKFILTFVKYLPQLHLNYKRQSTFGWSINQVLLDATGGICSMLQILVDSFILFPGDAKGNISGNLIKFGLGAYSLLMDLVFMYQHYVEYGHVERVVERAERRRKQRTLADAEREPLIGDPP